MILVRRVAALALFLPMVGCGTASRSTTAEFSNCAYAYVLAVGSTEVETQSCAGVIPSHPSEVKVRLGDKFSVVVLHEQDGHLDLPVLSPDGSAVAQVQRRGASTVYIGRSVGTSVLVARHTRACLAAPGVTSCTAFTVDVVRG